VVAGSLKNDGKGARFQSWDETAEAVAANNSHAFENYTHDD